MALTNEMISANAELAGLTPEQITAIVTLSQNDENAVIGTRIGEIYREMDATITSATGIERNGDEKTYNFLARATKEIVEKANKVDALDIKITELKNEKARLQKIIDDGGADDETKKQLATARKSVETLTAQYTALKTEYDDAKTKHTQEIFNMQLNNEFANVTANIKFKTEYPDSVKDVIVNQAIAKVKAMNPEYVEMGNGKQLVFTKDGAQMLNPENLMKPYTAKELVTKELKEMGVLADVQGGGGTNPNPNIPNTTIDLSSVKTRTQATDVINKILMQKGLTKGSNEFQTEFTKIWKENNISKLPM